MSRGSGQDAGGAGMKNAVGGRITLQDTVWRAATSYTYGGSTYQSIIQRLVGPGDAWDSGKCCQHAHRSAETALSCGEVRLSRKTDRWIGITPTRQPS